MSSGNPIESASDTQSLGVFVCANVRGTGYGSAWVLFPHLILARVQKVCTHLLPAKTQHIIQVSASVSLCNAISPFSLFFFQLSVLFLHLHILLCRWRWVIVVTAMVLIDEGELSCGLQQKTLEDTEAAIHPPSHLHTPTTHCGANWNVCYTLCSFIKCLCAQYTVS